MRFTGVDHERVLWNFPAATRLTLNQLAVMGSVLALFAAGDFSGGSINGRAVLGGPVISTQGFEFHNFLHAMAIVNMDRRTAELADGNNHSGATYTLFPVELDFAPAPEGTRIAWNSTPGFLYVVERADNLNGPFTDIAANLPATPPLNQFIDPDPPESGMVFYRVWGYRP